MAIHEIVIWLNTLSVPSEKAVKYDIGSVSIACQRLSTPGLSRWLAANNAHSANSRIADNTGSQDGVITCNRCMSAGQS